jgi:hypothetical protein
MFGIRGLWFEQGGEPSRYARSTPPEQRERRFHDVRDETVSNLGAQPLARATDRAEHREGGMDQRSDGFSALFSPQV